MDPHMLHFFYCICQTRLCQLICTPSLSHSLIYVCKKALSSHGHALLKLWLQLHAFSRCELHDVCISVLGVCYVIRIVVASMPLWGQRSVHKASLTASSSLCNVNPSICCAAWRTLTWTSWKDWAELDNGLTFKEAGLQVNGQKLVGPLSKPLKWIVQQLMWFRWICHCVKSLRKAESLNNLQISSSMAQPMWRNPFLTAPFASSLLRQKACWFLCSFHFEKRDHCSQ